MKALRPLGCLFGLAIAGLGIVMAVTNPTPEAYEEYAVEQLTLYLKEEGCPRAAEALGSLGQEIEEQCNALVQDNQGQLRRLIVDGTTRQNYIVLSLYTTDLSFQQFLPPVISEFLLPPTLKIPTYHFETVGVFRQFFIYQAEKQTE